MSRTYAQQLAADRLALWNEFKRRGGRSIELAEEIDEIDRELAKLAARKKPGAGRRANPRAPDRAAYRFYVVLQGKILSGWEFREDAKECVVGNYNGQGSIYSRSYLKARGLDPAVSANWGGYFPRKSAGRKNPIELKWRKRGPWDYYASANGYKLHIDQHMESYYLMYCEPRQKKEQFGGAYTSLAEAKSRAALIPQGG